MTFFERPYPSTQVSLIVVGDKTVGQVQVGENYDRSSIMCPELNVIINRITGKVVLP